jgi:3-oxoadipate enol-lactonase
LLGDSRQRPARRARTIRAPTLVISGSEDVPTPATDGRYLAGQIAGACYEELAAAHLSIQELPDAFAMLVRQFLLTP